VSKKQIGAEVVSLAAYRAAKEVVAANIRSWLRHGTSESRVAMETTVRAIMENHHVRNMVFGSFWVHYLPGMGLVIAAKNHKKARGCPRCGSVDNRYLHTDAQAPTAHAVTWGCVECGEIYGTWEDIDDDAS